MFNKIIQIVRVINLLSEPQSICDWIFGKSTMPYLKILITSCTTKLISQISNANAHTPTPTPTHKSIIMIQREYVTAYAKQCIFKFHFITFYISFSFVSQKAFECNYIQFKNSHAWWIKRNKGLFREVYIKAHHNWLWFSVYVNHTTST